MWKSKEKEGQPNNGQSSGGDSLVTAEEVGALVMIPCGRWVDYRLGKLGDDTYTFTTAEFRITVSRLNDKLKVEHRK